MKRTQHSITGSWNLLRIAACLAAVALAVTGCAADDGDDGDDDATGGSAGVSGGDTGGATSGGTAGGGTGGGGAGTGGGDTGGTAGGDTGGGGNVDSVCYNNVSAPVSAQLDDLEGGVMPQWDIYMSTPDDATAGGTLTAPAGTHDDPPEVVTDDGADGTTSSIHYAGTGWYSYGAGMNYNLEGCKDLNAYTGVRFWAKGSTTPGADQVLPPTLTPNFLNFRVITAGAHGVIMEDGVNVGGDCDTSGTGCYMPPQINITLTDEWQQFDIPFTDLNTPAGAALGSAFTGDNAMLLGWHSENGDFDFYIDELEFY